jgi:hypothetical protein
MKTFTNAEFKELRLLVLAEQKLSDTIIAILKERLADADKEIARLKNQTEPVAAFTEHWQSMCPHTHEQGFPVDADDLAAHTNCDCGAVTQADGHAEPYEF